MVAKKSGAGHIFRFIPDSPLVSGAGDDTTCLAICGPMAMIFVPGMDGRSHIQVENADWRDREAGANALLHYILDFAMGN